MASPSLSVAFVCFSIVYATCFDIVCATCNFNIVCATCNFKYILFQCRQDDNSVQDGQGSVAESDRGVWLLVWEWQYALRPVPLPLWKQEGIWGCLSGWLHFWGHWPDKRMVSIPYGVPNYHEILMFVSKKIIFWVCDATMLYCSHCPRQWSAQRVKSNLSFFKKFRMAHCIYEIVILIHLLCINSVDITCFYVLICLLGSTRCLFSQLLFMGNHLSRIWSATALYLLRKSYLQFCFVL